MAEKAEKNDQGADLPVQKNDPGIDPPAQIDGEADVPGQDEYVHLPALISDEFGTPAQRARMEIALGTVDIDGELVQGDKFDFKREDILGKEIVVVSETRQYKFTYRNTEKG